MKEKYEELEKQYWENPLYFKVAIYTILNHGLNHFKEAPMTSDALDSNLFADNAKTAISSLVNSLADASPNILLALIKRNMEYPSPSEGIPPLHLYGDEDGICPVCGAKIDSWGSTNVDDCGTMVSWKCLECGATGKAGYDSVFDHHYMVCDANGKELPGREK